MKKYLPFLLLGLGVIVLIGAFFVIKAKKKAPVEEEEVVAEIPFEKRPVVSLTPSEDGHWLKLVIEKIEVEASTLDYELLYKLPDGRTQGVPGTVKLSGGSIERELLLGSESSGKFRYDEGVVEGTLTLRFRNEKGKLMGKLSTQFNLQTEVKAVSSADGKFTYTFDKTPKEGFFIVMETFGVYKVPSGSVQIGPYGVFSSLGEKLPGKLDLSASLLQMWSGTAWEDVEGGKASDIGVFIGI